MCVNMMPQKNLKSFKNGLYTRTKIKDIECLANRIYRVQLRMGQKYVVILFGKKHESHCPLHVHNVFFIYIDDFIKQFAEVSYW